MGKKRPTGPMVPITDDDITNLKYIRDASSSLRVMAEWTGFSQASLRNWLKGEEVEMHWRESVKKKIAKVAHDLNPEPVAKPCGAVFKSEHPLMFAYKRVKRLINESTNDAVIDSLGAVAGTLAMEMIDDQLRGEA